MSHSVSSVQSCYLCEYDQYSFMYHFTLQLQLSAEDAAVVGKAYFSPAVAAKLTVVKVRQACQIEEICFSKKLDLASLLVYFGRKLIENKRVSLYKRSNLTREDIELL